MDFDLRGTIRARKPSDTLRIIEPYIKKAGITRIANLTHLDCIGVPVYTCIRPGSKSLATSQGKGISDELAMCSAYMESIEHYFSENIKPDLIAPITEIAPEDRVDLDKLPAGGIIKENKEALITRWSLCESLLNQKSIYFPTEFFCFDLTEPHIENSIFKKTTTGLASGNNTLEATCHAIYECIERYMSYLFASMPYQEKIDRMLNLSTVEYPEAAYFINRLAENHIDCVIFDLTQVFNVPTFHAIIADENPFRKLGNYSGTGTHWDPGIAICRAITEAIQSRLTYIAGSRDDMFPKDYKLKWQPLKFTGTRSFKTTYEHTPSYQSHFSLEDQLNWLLKKLAEQNYHPYRHVHTSIKNDSIAVVKVMIPDLAL